MSCPTGQIIAACDFPQFFVDQQPRFDEMIMEDIRPTDGWIGNVSMGTTPMGTPTEITQDRFKSVFPNTTKTWVRTNAASCQGNPCDPNEARIGWGASRLTYYAEQQSWATPLLCYDQDMHVTQAEQHLSQIISEILRPATQAIMSNFLRKRTLQWSDKKIIANKTLTPFTFAWQLADIDGNGVADEEVYFNCSAAPNNVFHLVPQMLQNQFSRLMRIGYAGKNPFKDTAPFVELVTDMDTCWFLDKLGGSVGVGGTPSVSGNWRFTEWGAANEYWRYGYSGQIGNFLTRVDELGLRFNFVRDLGAGAAPNRYQYQIVLPFKNSITSGAGGAPGLGSEPNVDFDLAHFALSFISHKKGLELLVPDAKPINPEMPFGHRNFGGKWQFVTDNLGADANGVVIQNKRRNKGQFIADFKQYIRPLHTEFLVSMFHKREQFCVPEIDTCSVDPGYPSQIYSSALPGC